MIAQRLWHLSRTATLAAIVGLGLLAWIGVVSYRSTAHLVNQLDQVAQVHRVSLQIAEQMVIVDEEESGLRGFLLTGDERFLARKVTAPLRFAAGLGHLRDLANDNRENLQDADQLGVLFVHRLAWSDKAIGLYKVQGPQAAAALLAGGSGQALTDAMRSLALGMQLREKAQLDERTASSTSSRDWVFLVLPIGAGVGIAVFAMALWLLNREGNKHQLAMKHLSQNESRCREFMDVTEHRQLTDEHSQFFNLSEDLLSIANIDGYFERISPSWSRCLGWTQAELTSRPWASFVHPEDLAESMRVGTDMATNGLPLRDYENRYLCKDGTYRWLSWNGKATSSQGKLYSIARDITENRRAQAHLRLIETCIANLNDMVVITEAEPQALPGPRIVYVNDAFLRRTGYAREEVIGQTPRILQGLHTQRDALERIGSAMRKWQPVREELINYTKTGEEFWIELDIVPVADAKGRFTHWIAIERDVSARKQTEFQLQLTASVFNRSRDGITITDPSGCILKVNEAFERITGYSQQEVLGKNSRILQSGRHGPEFYAALWHAVSHQGHWFGEIWNRRKTGEIYPELLNIDTVRDGAGVTTNYLAVFTDMSDLKRHQQLLDRITNLDPLTGLPNRNKLRDRTEQDITLAQRSGENLTLMMLSVDNFKALNLSLGHQAGDRFLIMLGERLKTVIRQQDTLGRLPGEGFVLVLPETGQSGALTLATKLNELLGDPFDVDGQQVSVTPSIGISSFPQDGTDFDELAACSASAMHRAKKDGGNTHQFFNESAHRAGVENLLLARELRMALGLGQLSLHYQPLVDLQTGQIGGMEALIRWQHPELGAVSPGRFIPVAEESGLIKMVGAWVLRRACQDIRHWQDCGLCVPHVAVNVSPVQLRDPTLVQQIESTLLEFGVDPSGIYLEVTEGALMEDVAKCEAILRSLKALGVKLSLDDFGTGYSSLSYLKLFPFDKVKIDKSFVQNMLTNKEDAVIATVVVAMAHGLGLRVIAEGVETEAQCVFLRNNMCDEIQGFFFSKALTAEAMQTLLQEARQLPSHLLREQQRSRTLLLVDDEPNIVAALKRLLRRDGYTILTAGSGQEGLEQLSQHPVDIIVSDQRMPGMTGVEFLRTAKALYPETLRIVLSGYTELQSVTDAINEGAIYRFLTKPWIDDQLRSFILEAFQHKELADENEKLSLKVRTTNSELARNNRELAEMNEEKAALIAQSKISLNVMRDTLERIPLAMVGVDEDGMVAFANAAAVVLFGNRGSLLGADLADTLPELDIAVLAADEGQCISFTLALQPYRVQWHRMGAHSPARGKIITVLETAASI